MGWREVEGRHNWWVWSFMRKMIMVGGCAVRRLSVSNTLSTRVCIHTRVARGQDGVEVKSMMDLVLVKEVMLRYVHDLRALTEIGRGLSDHYVVLCKVMLLGLWIKRREVVMGMSVWKVTMYGRHFVKVPVSEARSELENAADMLEGHWDRFSTEA